MTIQTKVARPPKPSYEFVGAPTRTWGISPTGTAVPEWSFSDEQIRALGRNLERRTGYERMLEMAPFWED